MSQKGWRSSVENQCFWAVQEPKEPCCQCGSFVCWTVQKCWFSAELWPFFWDIKKNWTPYKMRLLFKSFFCWRTNPPLLLLFLLTSPWPPLLLCNIYICYAAAYCCIHGTVHFPSSRRGWLVGAGGERGQKQARKGPERGQKEAIKGSEREPEKRPEREARKRGQKRDQKGAD